jgi:glycosyltransferase involved in cell wall biosynthesis
VRIVYLNPCGKWGGAETSLRQLLQSVRTAEPSWELWLWLGEDGPLAGAARDLGVQVVVQPFPRALGRLGEGGGGLGALWSILTGAVPIARYTLSLAVWLRAIKPDIMHTNGFKMHLLGAWTRPRQTPLVWHIHDYVSSRRLMSRLVRLFAGACTVAIVNSRSVARDLQRLLPKLRTAPIYNAIDVHQFSPAGQSIDLDAAAGLAPAADGTIRVGLVATFARWKGHRVFLEALAQLLSEASIHGPVRGYVIGGPIYQTDGSQWSLPELQREAERLGLTGKVGFTGFIDDPASAMRSLDILVHASTAPEPFGMVIIEGMACGKAVIASQAGGAAELFTDGENALGHPPGNALELSHQMLRLVNDPALRNRLGTAGRTTAVGRYNTQRLAQELVSVYVEICGGPVETESSIRDAGLAAQKRGRIESTNPVSKGQPGAIP